MHHSVKFIAALLTSAFLLSGCGSGLISLEYEDGCFVNSRRGLSYQPASAAYEPALTGEPYAYYKKGDVTFCAIGDNDPALWLAEDVSGVAAVLYSDTITLPTLAEFGAEKIIVCDSDAITVGIAEVTDPALIAQIVESFTSGEGAEWPLVGADARYDLKFSSSAWPQFMINLVWGSFPEGNFLYDRASGRCVEIGNLLDSVFRTEAAS